MTAEPKTCGLKLSPFDVLVGTIVSILMLFSALVWWHGNQIGLVVLAQTPASGSTVSIASHISVQFEQTIRFGEQNVLQIEPPLSGTLTYADKQIKFIPDQPLESNMTYHVQLSGIQSETGQTLAEALRWEFSTRSAEIIYLHTDDAGYQQLHRLKPMTGDMKILTSEAFGVWDFAPAPDGNWVVYAALRQDQGSDLWLIDADGQRRTSLVACPNQACHGMAWSPNSETILYERYALQDDELVSASARLWQLDMASGQTAPLFANSDQVGYAPAWSADGQWISYLSPISQEIHFFNRVDGRQRVITSQTRQGVIWHPQKNLALVTTLKQVGEGFSTQLTLVEPASGELRNLSGDERITEDSLGTWSSDGAILAFTRKAPRATMGQQIWLAPLADPSQANYLTETPQTHYGLPHWSPDGRYLLFQTRQLDQTGNDSTLHLLTLQTNQIHYLGLGLLPRWLP